MSYLEVVRNTALAVDALPSHDLAISRPPRLLFGTNSPTATPAADANPIAASPAPAGRYASRRTY